MYRKFKPVTKKVKNSRKKWNRPTMQMLIKELQQATSPNQRKMVQGKIDQVRAWCKSNPETVTYYPDRKIPKYP